MIEFDTDYFLDGFNCIEPYSKSQEEPYQQKIIQFQQSTQENSEKKHPPKTKKVKKPKNI